MHLRTLAMFIVIFCDQSLNTKKTAPHPLSN